MKTYYDDFSVVVQNKSLTTYAKIYNTLIEKNLDKNTQNDDVKMLMKTFYEEPTKMSLKILLKVI